MKRIIAFFLCLSLLSNSFAADLNFRLKDLHAPIPAKHWVRNHTGVQCVWSSIETLGRWAEEPKLVNPPITDRKECKGSATPISTDKMLKNLKVKFFHTVNKDIGRKVFRRWVTAEGRGVLFGVPSHAMVCVHYDEKNNLFGYINNSDLFLSVRMTTITAIEKIWTGWVLAIFADKDKIINKIKMIRSKKLDMWFEKRGNFLRHNGYQFNSGY